MSDNVAQLSEAMAIMRTKDVQHLINRIKELEANAIANRVAIMRLEAKLRQLTEHNKSQAKPADFGAGLSNSVNDTAP